jgi:hypothetical protein
VFSSFQVKIRSFQINGKLVKVGSRKLQDNGKNCINSRRNQYNCKIG